MAAAIVWEEARRALWAWASEYVFVAPHRVSLIREVDKAADCVVKWFCDYRSANEAEFFVEYCDYGCSDLADLAQKAGGWADYNPWRSSAFSARRGIVCGRGVFAWVFRGRTWGLSSLGSSLLV